MKKFSPKGREVLKQEVLDNYGLDPETQNDLIEKIVEDRYKDEEFKANEKNRTEKLRAERENLFKAKEYYKKNPKAKEQKPNGENYDDRYVTKDELKSFSHRQRFPHLTDEEYSNIKALANANKTSFEETLEKNPVAIAYMQTVDTDKRLAGAVRAPGTRINTGEQKTEEDKVADELSSDLPRGFSLPKSN